MERDRLAALAKEVAALQKQLMVKEIQCTNAEQKLRDLGRINQEREAALVATLRTSQADAAAAKKNVEELRKKIPGRGTQWVHRKDRPDERSDIPLPARGARQVLIGADDHDEDSARGGLDAAGDGEVCSTEGTHVPAPSEPTDRLSGAGSPRSVGTDGSPVVVARRSNSAVAHERLLNAERAFLAGRDIDSGHCEQLPGVSSSPRSHLGLPTSPPPPPPRRGGTGSSPNSPSAFHRRGLSDFTGQLQQVGCEDGVSSNVLVSTFVRRSSARLLYVSGHGPAGAIGESQPPADDPHCHAQHAAGRVAELLRLLEQVSSSAWIDDNGLTRTLAQLICGIARAKCAALFMSCDSEGEGRPAAGPLPQPALRRMVSRQGHHVQVTAFVINSAAHGLARGAARSQTAEYRCVVEKGTVFHALETGHAVLVEDCKADSTIHVPEEDAPRDMTPSCTYTLPLRKANGKVFGALHLLDPHTDCGRVGMHTVEQHAEADAVRRLLEMTAELPDVSSVVPENSCAPDAFRALVRALLAGTMTAALHVLRATVAAEVVSLVISSNDGTHAQTTAVGTERSTGAQWSRAESTVKALNQCPLSRHVMETSEPVHIPAGASEHPEFGREFRGLKLAKGGVLAVPVVGEGGHVLGALWIADRRDELPCPPFAVPAGLDPRGRWQLAPGTAPLTVACVDSPSVAARVWTPKSRNGDGAGAGPGTSVGVGVPHPTCPSEDGDTARAPQFGVEEEDCLWHVAASLGRLATAVQHRCRDEQTRQTFVSFIRASEMMSATVDVQETGRQVVRALHHLLQPQRATFYLLDKNSQELVSVHSTTSAAELVVPLRGTAAGDVIRSGATVNAHGPAQTGRLLARLGYLVGQLPDGEHKIESLLLVPVRSYRGTSVGLLELVNRATRLESARRFPLLMEEPELGFSKAEQSTVEGMAQQAALCMHRAHLFKALETNQLRNDALMRIAKLGAEDGTNVDEVIQTVIEITYGALSAERVTLFVVDELRQELWCKVSQDAKGFRIPMSSGIAGMVAKSGQAVNIVDAYSNSHFDRSFDAKTGFRTRNILCVPVKDATGKVIGVTQAINHIDTGANGRRAGSGREKTDTEQTPFSADDLAVLEAINGEISGLLKRKALEATFMRYLDDMAEGTEKGFIQQYMQPRRQSHAALDPNAAASSGGGSGGGGAGDSSPGSSGSRRVARQLSSVQAAKPANTRSMSVFDLEPEQLSTIGAHTGQDRGGIDAQGSSGVEHNGDGPEVRDDSNKESGSASGPQGASTEAGPLPTVSTTAPPTARETSAASTSNDADSTATPAVTVTAADSSVPPAGTLMPPSSGAGAQAHVQQQQQPPQPPQPPHDAPGAGPPSVASADLVPKTFFQRAIKARGLQAVMDWDFDVFSTDDGLLVEYAASMFVAFDMPSAIGFEFERLLSFLQDIRGNYRQNPYHNFKHGFSVLHCTFLVIVKDLPKASTYLTLQDVFSAFIAAIGHDVDHPGTNNGFSISSGDALAVTYNDKSVLENHHSATTFRLLARPQNNLMAEWPYARRKEVRGFVVAAILGTDVAEHFSSTQHLQRLLDERSLSVASEEDRKIMVVSLIHGGDLSNGALPNKIAVEWASRVMAEFEEQAAEEGRKGLPVTGWMVGATQLATKAKINIGFLEVIAMPMWRLMARMWPHLQANVQNMEQNRDYWKGVSAAASAAT